MWRIIGVTPDIEVKDEHKIICEYLNQDVDFFHVRKPMYNKEQMKEYLNKFPDDARAKITLHTFAELVFEMGFGGVHFNNRNPFNEMFTKGVRISYSCHNVADMIEKRELFDYVFLSPIYDSLSKYGYKSPFQLELLKASNLITDKVIALGGVTRSKFGELKEMGFGGVAMLGEFWNQNIVLNDK